MNRLRVGDVVVVISGKSKGKTGKISEIFHDSGKLIVEGINIVSRHEKPLRKGEKGKMSKKEAPLFACKVMPIDPVTGKGTRVRCDLIDGKKVRKSIKGNVLGVQS
jgi:large subunit ribosomal protein L24